MPTIGIVCGAGPEAGAVMFEQVVRACQQKYGCKRDSDYPTISLLSYPFSEMLQGNIDAKKLSQELVEAASRVNATYFAVACNTLHAFMDENFPKERCIHLMEETKKTLGDEVPLVLCSGTSRRAGIHKKFFECLYPDQETQAVLDQAIDDINAGKFDASLSQRIEAIVQKAFVPRRTVVLGCTEFSLLHSRFPLCNLRVLDPSELAAQRLCERYFER